MQNKIMEKNKKMDGVDAYNVVADTVTGVNIHLKDNIIQLVSCIVGFLLGGIIGFFLGSMVIGCVIGLIAGLFLSGLFIMVYRFVMHVKGKHK